MAKMLKIARVGSGLPIVLIHGWGLNSGVWQPCIEMLKQDFELITVDLPGFGVNVEHGVAPYTLDNIADVIKQTVGKPAVYCGWSLGGLVATKIAAQHPHLVKSLITVASSPCFVEQENWPGIKQDVLSSFHRQLEQDTKKTINNFLKIQAMGSPHVRQDIKLIRDLVMKYPVPTKQILDDSLNLLENEDLRPLISEISVPFLRIYGKLDGLVPRSVISQVDEFAPQSDKIIFDQASHAPFISDIEQFSSALSVWLTKHSA